MKRVEQEEAAAIEFLTPDVIERHHVHNLYQPGFLVQGCLDSSVQAAQGVGWEEVTSAFQCKISNSRTESP